MKQSQLGSQLRDVRCPLCKQNFDYQNRKPMHICQNNHKVFICELCHISIVNGLLQPICPQCSNNIRQSKVRPINNDQLLKKNTQLIQKIQKIQHRLKESQQKNTMYQKILKKYQSFNSESHDKDLQLKLNSLETYCKMVQKQKLQLEDTMSQILKQSEIKQNLIAKQQKEIAQLRHKDKLLTENKQQNEINQQKPQNNNNQLQQKPDSIRSAIHQIINIIKNQPTKIYTQDRFGALNNQQIISCIQSHKQFPNFKRLTRQDININQNILVSFSNNSFRFINLQSICLSFLKLFYISDKGWIIFAKSLSKLPKLQQIQLSNNQLGNQSLGVFFNNISTNLPTLQSISFNDNEISDGGLIYFLNNCTKFPYLQKIDFGKNRITDKGFNELAKNSAKLLNLKTIDFGFNRITDSGLIALVMNGSKYPNLQYLVLNNNKISDQGLMGFFPSSSKFPRLQLLEVEENQISQYIINIIKQNNLVKYVIKI